VSLQSARSSRTSFAGGDHDCGRAGRRVVATRQAHQVLIGLTPATALRRFGGTAAWSQLREHVTQDAVRRAVRDGEVVRLRRGCYGLPDLPPATEHAARAGGVVSHLSAAQEHRLPLLLPPEAAHVTVPPNSAARPQPGVRLHWRTVAAADLCRSGVTSVLRTVLDCARDVPRAEALAVADAALRLGLVTPAQLDAAGSAGCRRGAPRVRWVARHADGGAAGPFESALRAAALDAGCQGFRTQVELRAGRRVRVDLADPVRRVVLEADSFEWHGSRQALRRDCRRYDELVRAGWVVLRFAWEDVMFDAGWVRDVIADVCAAQNSTVAKVPSRAKPTRS